MKIAIQGHPTRGKEVIQIFKDLGTEGLMDHTGSHIDWVYLRDDSLRPNQLIVGTDITFLKGHGYKVYTLEEFEKEFPFKIGDEVIYDYDSNFVGTIVDIKFDDHIPYRVDIKGTICTCGTNMLKSYKEMKEERNITLTLDKAKEWYNKGGELREISLQAFSEKELNPLPRSWKEFVKLTKFKFSANVVFDDSISYSNGCFLNKSIGESSKIWEKHLALIQLEQLRDCWRQGNIPQELKYKIRKIRNIYTVVYGAENAFLSFCDKQTAEEFLECFRDLIEKAGDLI